MSAKVLILSLLFLINNQDDFVLIRSRFSQAVEKKAKAEELLEILKAKPKTPFNTGYLGAVYMVMAKHAFNPVMKFSYFSTGKDYLDSSIRQSPGNEELRFLRYSIQVSAPSFLGYNAHKEADRALLMRNLKSGKITDKQLQATIVKFLMRGKCTAEEKMMLSKIHSLNKVK
jgi:hypothetical protein